MSVFIDLHCGRNLVPFTMFDIGQGKSYFTQHSAEDYKQFERVFSDINNHIANGESVNIGVSHDLLRIFKEEYPEGMQALEQLSKSGKVSFVCSSHAFVFSQEAFMNEMVQLRAQIGNSFGQSPLLIHHPNSEWDAHTEQLIHSNQFRKINAKSVADQSISHGDLFRNAVDQMKSVYNAAPEALHGDISSLAQWDHLKQISFHLGNNPYDYYISFMNILEDIKQRS